MRRAALVVALALLAQGAAAAPWGGGGPAKRQSPRREALVREGDRFMAKAKNRDRQQNEYARQAVAAYEQALAMGDEGAADLHYRAFLAASQYMVGDAAERYHAVIRHIDGLRAADPRDPREMHMLPDLCTALSKLGGMGGPKADELFARGVREYDLWRARIDETDDRFASSLATYWVNAAELLMAMGPDHLEQAIRYYEEGVDLAGSSQFPALAYYGVAVAYDRDGQWSRAVKAMQEALAIDRSNGAMANLMMDTVYFVPQGDLHYYLALGYHVQGRYAEALSEYREFLRVTTATKYAHRAREHIAELENGTKAP